MSVAAPRRINLSLRGIIAAILIIILLLPLSGVYIFRIHENELIRQTESELIAQGVVLAALYRAQLQALPNLPPDYGNAIMTPEAVDHTAAYSPILPQLTLPHSPVLPNLSAPAAATAAAQDYEARLGLQLRPVLEEAKRRMMVSIRLLNPSGTVIGGTNEIGTTLAEAVEVQQALQGHYASALRERHSNHPDPALASISRASSVRVFVALPVIMHDRTVGVVYLSRSPRNILKALYEEREGLFWSGCFVISMTWLIGWILSRMISRPTRNLSRYARALAAGETPLPPHQPIVKELASLNQSIAVMAQTLAARSAYIRDFALHLTHEFKTPLTAIQGAIELMQDHWRDMTQEQQSRFLDNIKQDTRRLQRLITRLLELARADAAQPGDETTNLLPLLHRLSQQYAGQLIVPEPEAETSAAIAEDALETVLVNLIGNSLQHGATQITCRIQPDPEYIMIEVSDNGSGISPGNAEQLFHPFFTTRRAAGGTGLGLAIVQSILKTYGGTIVFVPQPGGACFRIMLRRA